MDRLIVLDANGGGTVERWKWCECRDKEEWKRRDAEKEF